MQKNFMIILLAFVLSCCAGGNYSNNIVKKSWHPSISTSPQTSQVYYFKKWEEVQLIEIGMDVKELQKIIGPIINYPDTTVAILLTSSPDSIYYEVAVKLMNFDNVEDISYKIQRTDSSAVKLLERNKR